MVSGTSVDSRYYDAHSFDIAQLKLSKEIVVVAPFVLPQNNWSFNSGKTNGVMFADVMRYGVQE